MKYGQNNSRAKASLVRWVRRLSGRINALRQAGAGRTAPHFSAAPFVPSAFCAGFVVLATLAVAAPARAQDITLVTNTSISASSSVSLGNFEFAQGFMTGGNMTGYIVTEIDILVDSETITVPPTVTLVKLSPTGANPVTLQGPASITANTDNLTVTYMAPVGPSLDASALYFVTITHSSNSASDAPQILRGTDDSETVESSGWSIDDAYKLRTKGGTYADNTQGYSALIAVRGTVNTSTNTAPAFTDTTLMRSIAENTAADTNIGTAIPAATDADGDTLTYTMAGTNAASFAFDPTTRQIKTKDALDFETLSSYSVTIKADDSNGGTATVDVTITVTDADDPPGRTCGPDGRGGRRAGAAGLDGAVGRWRGGDHRLPIPLCTRRLRAGGHGLVDT